MTTPGEAPAPKLSSHELVRRAEYTRSMHILMNQVWSLATGFKGPYALPKDVHESLRNHLLGALRIIQNSHVEDTAARVAERKAIVDKLIGTMPPAED
jgi:hypothetical protein